MSTQTCTGCDSPGNGNCPACHGKGKILGAEISGASYGPGQESPVPCARVVARAKPAAVWEKSKSAARAASRSAT